MKKSNASLARKTVAGQRVRIIGGQWRSRLVRFPAVPGLRPTANRVRETLFNWLGQDLGGKTCLDLFAGSGALGFEALSRNAAGVIMVECVPAVRAALATTAATLGAGPRLEIVGGDALQFLRKVERRFDLVFLDPPFNQGWLDRLWPLLPAVLAPAALVYIECEFALAPPASWHVLDSGKAGVIHFHLVNHHE